MTVGVLIVWGLALGLWGIDTTKTIIAHTVTACRDAWTVGQRRRQSWL